MNTIITDSIADLIGCLVRLIPPRLFLIVEIHDPETHLGQTLVIITTLIGALGGVITAVGGIWISMERIKSENERMKLARDDQIRALQEELRLLYVQVAETPEGKRLINQVRKIRSYRDSPSGFPDPSDPTLGEKDRESPAAFDPT